MFEIRAEQLELQKKITLIEKLDQSFCRQNPNYTKRDDKERFDFLVDCLLTARELGFKTKQGLASYALAAYYLGIGFENMSQRLQALLSSTVPEVRRVYSMNEWVLTIIGDPENLALADETLQRAFDLTSAWGCENT